MRAYKNPHGYVVDLPEFKIRQREPVPVTVLERGLCATTKGLDASIFFPDPTAGRSAGKEAKAVCARCPVQLSCLHYSIRSREEAGVWGGVTENQRRKFVSAYGKTGKLPWFCAVCRKPYVRIDSEPYCSAPCYRRYEGSTARLKRQLLALAGQP